MVLRLVSFIAARHFVGSPLCEDEEWISTALTYTENAFKTIITLRIFPDWVKFFVAFLLPFSYRVNWALRRAKRIIVPLIEERRRREREDPGYEKPDDFLQYMIDGASEFDGQPDKLAHRLLILTLAAVHTTSMAATQTLFDLCAHPEYIELLRQEILDVLQKEGGYTKQTLTHFKKLDSFMRESQRMNPPSLRMSAFYLILLAFASATSLRSNICSWIQTCGSKAPHTIRWHLPSEGCPSDDAYRACRP